MDIKTRLLKMVIGLFLLLNIFVLVFGYNAIEDKFDSNSDYVSSTQENYIRKEETLQEKLDILTTAKTDIYANIKTLTEKTNQLKAKINESMESFQSSADEKLFYQNKIASLQQENSNLKSTKNSLQKQLQQKQQQQAAQQAMAKAKTRSS